MGIPAAFYENVGDKLKGVEAVRAYRAAQNHLHPGNSDFLASWKRLQDKIARTTKGEGAK